MFGVKKKFGKLVYVSVLSLVRSSCFIFGSSLISARAFFQSAEHWPRRDFSPMYLWMKSSICALFASVTVMLASVSTPLNHFQHVNFCFHLRLL